MFYIKVFLEKVVFPSNFPTFLKMMENNLF